MEVEARIGHGIFGLESRREIVEPVDHLRFAAGRDGHDGLAAAGDGVALVAGADPAEIHVIREDLLHEAGNLLDAIDAPLVDIVAAVAALAATDGEAGNHGTGQQFALTIGKRAHRIHAAGAADAEVALVLVVEVDERLAGDESLLHGTGAVEAGLFRYREEAFEAGMRNRIVVEDGHRRGHADAVVGAEGRVVGDHPAVFDDILDGIGGKIEA